MSERTRDSREINFIDYFKTGSLKVILDYIVANPDLNLCFRGNATDKEGRVITIYKNNHRLLNIIKMLKAKYSYKLEFNYKHVTEEEKDDYKHKLGARWSLKQSKDNERMECELTDNDDRDFICKSLDCLVEILDKYFLIKGNSLLEKKRQHELFAAFSDVSNAEEDYFIYDLEFYPPKNFYENLPSNQADFLAVNYNAGCVNKIVFGEVKSKEGALSGKSGLLSHLEKMLKWKDNIVFVNNRKRELKVLLEHYAKLGLSKNVEDINFLDVDKCDVEILVILTDDAIDKYDKASGEGKDTYRNIVDKEYSDKGVVVKKFVNGKLEDI